MRDFGTTRKLPSGRWQATYWHEGVRRSAPKTFLLKAEATDWLSGEQTDINRGTWVDPTDGRRRLEEYADEWLKTRAGLTPKTIVNYRWLLDSYIFPKLGSTPVADLTSAMVRTWFAGIEYPTTAAKAYRLLATICNTAVSDRVILTSPCRLEGAGSEKAPERPTASVEEIGQLADAMPARMRVAVLLGAWCQLRLGELLGLRRRDIDPLHGTLSITKAKSSAGIRTLAVPPAVMVELVDHLDTYSAPGPDGWVFTGTKGGRLSTSVWNPEWTEAREKVGRTDLHFHDLRHTGLTLVAASGATIAELMHRAGHASPAAALRYQHATKERDRALASALDETIKVARRLHEATAASL
jgi:integrase